MKPPTCPKCNMEMTNEYYEKLRNEMIKSVKTINKNDEVRGISRSMNYNISLHCEKCNHIWYDPVYRVG